MIVTSQVALAAELRLSSKQVQQYLTRGMPGRDGHYDHRECLDWLREPGNPWAQHRPRDESRDDLEKEKLALGNARLALKLEQESGALVERQAVWAGVMRVFHRVRCRLQAIPAEVGSSVPPDQRAQIIATWKEKIVLVLSEMEHWKIED